MYLLISKRAMRQAGRRQGVDQAMEATDHDPNARTASMSVCSARRVKRCIRSYTV